MDATMILIDSDAEFVRARALVDLLWNSNDPKDVVRLEAQARLISAYEEHKWPRLSLLCESNTSDSACSSIRKTYEA